MPTYYYNKYDQQIREIVKTWETRRLTDGTHAYYLRPKYLMSNLAIVLYYHLIGQTQIVASRLLTLSLLYGTPSAQEEIAYFRQMLPTLSGRDALDVFGNFPDCPCNLCCGEFLHRYKLAVLAL